MTISDPISDMFARIRNGMQRTKDVVRAPHSRARGDVLRVMKEEGFIVDFTETGEGATKEFEITLKYHNGKPVISEMHRISRPGLRHYSSAKEIPTTRNGLGITIVSTSQGVMTDTKARQLNIGGEVLAGVF